MENTPHGFEEDTIITDSTVLFNAFWQEWIHATLYLITKEMQLDDILYKEVFNRLPKGKQSAIIGRKADFRQKAGMSL